MRRQFPSRAAFQSHWRSGPLNLLKKLTGDGWQVHALVYTVKRSLAAQERMCHTAAADEVISLDRSISRAPYNNVTTPSKRSASPVAERLPQENSQWCLYRAQRLHLELMLNLRLPAMQAGQSQEKWLQSTVASGGGLSGRRGRTFVVQREKADKRDAPK